MDRWAWHCGIGIVAYEENSRNKKNEESCGFAYDCYIAAFDAV